MGYLIFKEIEVLKYKKWQVQFEVSEDIKDYVKKNKFLNNGDTGFFITAPLSEKRENIRNTCKLKILDFIKG